VGKPASGLGGVQTTALETSAVDDDWLSAINVAKGWYDAGDDGAVVECVCLEHSVLHTAQVVTAPSNDQRWIEQPGIGWSRHGDLVLGNTGSGTSSSTEHDLHVGQYVVQLRIIKEITGHVDRVSLPAKVRSRAGDDGAMSEYWARNHLSWEVPPDRHCLGGQAVARRNTLHSDCGIRVSGLNCDVDRVEQDCRSGRVEPLGVKETTTVEGDLVVGSWVGVAVAGAQRRANRTIVVGWAPHLAFEANRLSCNSELELDVHQYVGVEICSSGWGRANNGIIQISWCGHHTTLVVAKEAVVGVPATKTKARNGYSLASRGVAKGWGDASDVWSVPNVVSNSQNLVPVPLSTAVFAEDHLNSSLSAEWPVGHSASDHEPSLWVGYDGGVSAVHVVDDADGISVAGVQPLLEANTTDGHHVVVVCVVTPDWRSIVGHWSPSPNLG